MTEAQKNEMLEIKRAVLSYQVGGCSFFRRVGRWGAVPSFVGWGGGGVEIILQVTT